MGFWNLAKDVAKGAAKSVMDTNAEALKYAERYSHLSKEELVYKFRNSSSTAEKMGIARVMKEKGYR